MGWFYGFKLHRVVNDRGELLAFRITPSNVDDRQPLLELTQGLTSKLFGDRGYLSQQLFRTLWSQGLQLITKVRRNMHNQLLPWFDKLLLRKRALIETINDQLKNIQQIEHTRHTKCRQRHDQPLRRFNRLHPSTSQTFSQFIPKRY